MSENNDQLSPHTALLTWQNDIYLNGLMGRRPETPIIFETLEARAREKLTPEAYGYIAGGAGAERTMAANL
jgi:lactate 2-monooxygenase